MSQKEIITRHLKDFDDWVPAYKLRSVNTLYGWIGHQGDKRCRELVISGILERRIMGKYAEFRYKKSVMVEYMPNNSKASLTAQISPNSAPVKADYNDISTLASKIPFGDLESLKILGRIKVEKKPSVKSYLIDLLKTRVGV